MVQISSFVGAIALLSSFAAGLPRPLPQDDSAIGIEVAVSAPNGIPLTDSVELASQSSREAAATNAPAPVITGYGGQQKPAEQHVPVVQVTTSSPVHQAPPVHTTSPVHQAPPVHQTSSPVHVTSSAVLQHETSSPVHVTTPVVHQQPATTHAPSMPTYGSGSAHWGNQEYNDCVQKCIATYGQAPGQYTPTATNTVPHATGTGATHTVIVAPTQGVLRYIPFAVNASVGDTIKFMWGANNHTVTKSSALLPCNRTGDALFASGVQNKDFVFTQVVNDTNPTYFYCATPGHCQKGMFGIINPATKFASPSSVGLQMQSIAQKSPNVAGYADITNKATLGNDQAARWGSNIEMADLPDWAHEYVAENVLYTRNFLASNPEVLKEDGSVDLSTANTTPLAIPQDIAAALNNAGSSGASSSSAPADTTSTPAATSSAPANSGVSENLNGSATSTLASPKVMIAVMAVVATLLL